MLKIIFKKGAAINPGINNVGDGTQAVPYEIRYKTLHL